MELNSIGKPKTALDLEMEERETTAKLFREERLKHLLEEAALSRPSEPKYERLPLTEESISKLMSFGATKDEAIRLLSSDE